MTREDWSGGSALPQVDELPVAEQGYERAAVQEAFDAFYHHIAQLDSTLRTLDAVDAFQRQASELRAELRTLRSAGWTLQPWRPGAGREPAVRTGVPPALPRVFAELVLLIVLAVFVGVGHFAPWVVIVVMAAGALLVTVVEVFASRERLPARAVAVAQERLELEEAPPAAAAAEADATPEPPRARAEPEPAYGWSAFGPAEGRGAEERGLAAVPPVEEVEPEPEPVAEEPLEEEPAAVEEPVVDEPAVEEPVAEQPVAAEEPALEGPAAEEPVAAEPVAEERAAEELPAEPEGEPEPVAEERAAEELPAEPEGEPEPVAVAAEPELDAPTEEPLGAAPAEPEPHGRRRWFGRGREDAAAAPEPLDEGRVPEPAPEPVAEPPAVEAAETGAVEPEPDAREERPEPEPEPQPAEGGWPEVGWPLAAGEEEQEGAPAEAPPAGRRRRLFGRRREEGAEQVPAPLEPPKHVRVLPASHGEDPWERGFDETMEPLGYVDEPADEASEDTEDDVSPRGLRRRRR